MMPFDDWFSKVGQAARDIAKESAETIRTTAGVGVGSISLLCPQDRYRAGDTIKGTLQLDLTDETEAKRLVVRLVATGVRKQVKVSTSGASASQTRETLYSFDLELDGEKTYPAGVSSHAFAVEIPEDVDRDVNIADGGVISEVAKVVSAFANAAKRPTEWKLTGFLDIPWKRNIKKTIDISVANKDEPIDAETVPAKTTSAEPKPSAGDSSDD